MDIADLYETQSAKILREVLNFKLTSRISKFLRVRMPVQRTAAGAAHTTAAEAVNQARRSGRKRGWKSLSLSQRTMAAPVNSQHQRIRIADAMTSV